jgi:aryl-alcohol dehydrogenase-like predicted oxidoreductase
VVRNETDGIACPDHVERAALLDPYDNRDKEQIMDTTILGKSGPEVSRPAFGTWELRGDWGSTDADAATAAIGRASDDGITFFDTAQAYGFGESERLLGAALGTLPRDRFVIATKGGLAPDELWARA